MEYISARNFRENQNRVLTKARNGQQIVLTSKVGTFKIVPMTNEEILAAQIISGVNEAKQIASGKAKGISIDNLLNEL